MASYSSFDDFINAQSSRKVYAFTLTVKKISDGTTVTLYWGTSDREIWDGSHYLFPILSELPRFTSGLSRLSGGRTMISWGNVVFGMQATEKIDPNNSLTMSDLVSDYTFSGQELVVKVGGSGLDWSNWQTLLKGYTGEALFSRTSLTIPIFSRAKKLEDKVFPPNVFGSDQWDKWQASTSYSQYDFISPTSDNGYYYQASSGGTSGTTEPTWPTTPGSTVTDGTVTWVCKQFPDSVDGKVRPLVYGEVKNISPVLIDENTKTYMVHDPSVGPISSIDAVYVNGVQKTLGTDYYVDTNHGIIWFASDPQGTVTANVKGATVSGTYISKPGDIWEEWIKTFGGFSSSDIDSTALSTYNTDVPYNVGIYINAKTNLASAIDQLLSGLLTHWGDTRDGTFTIVKFSAAGSTSDMDLDETSMLALDVVPIEEIYYRITVRGERNWTVQTNPDSSVSQSRREWLKEAYREAVVADTSVQTTFPLAKELIVNTNLVSMSDAETVAGWWKTLFCQRRWLVKTSIGVQGTSLEVGDVVKITYDHFGFSSGKYGRVTKLEDSHNRSQGAIVKLEVFI